MTLSCDIVAPAQPAIVLTHSRVRIGCCLLRFNCMDRYAGDQSGVAEFEERLMKPLPSYADDPDMRDFAQLISRDIFTANPNVHWDDVAGLDVAKRLLKEAVVMPIKYVLSLFSRLRIGVPLGFGCALLTRNVRIVCSRMQQQVPTAISWNFEAMERNASLRASWNW